jgi:hypothetical protein
LPTQNVVKLLEKSPAAEIPPPSPPNTAPPINPARRPTLAIAKEIGTVLQAVVSTIKEYGSVAKAAVGARIIPTNALKAMPMDEQER